MNVQIALIIIVFLMIVYLSDRFFNREYAYSPIRLFSLWWICNVSMSLYRVWGRDIASEDVYFSILVSIFCVIFGIFFARLVNIGNGQVFKNDFLRENVAVAPKGLLIINLLLLCLNIWLFARCFSINGSKMFLEIGVSRGDIYASGGVINSALDTYLHSYVLRGFLYTIVVLLPGMYVNKGTKKNNVFLFSLFNILFYTFIYGGRMFLFFAAIILITGVGIVYRYGKEEFHFFESKNESRKTRKSMFALVVLFASIVVMLTFNRNNSGQSNGFQYFIEKSITYFSSAPMYYDKLLHVTTAEEQSGFQFTFIGGLITFLSHFNKLISLNLIPDVVSNASGHLTKNLINVGGDVWTNAFPTMVYTFRYDFGFAGIIINSVAFGFISETIYRNMVKICSGRLFFFYMIVVYFIIESPMRWSGQQFWPWFVILMVCTLARRECCLRYKVSLIRKLP